LGVRTVAKPNVHGVTPHFVDVVVDLHHLWKCTVGLPDEHTVAWEWQWLQVSGCPAWPVRRRQTNWKVLDGKRWSEETWKEKRLKQGQSPKIELESDVRRHSFLSSLCFFPLKGHVLITAPCTPIPPVPIGRAAYSSF
jgi:hypothetical protein